MFVICNQQEGHQGAGRVKTISNALPVNQGSRMRGEGREAWEEFD